MIHSGLYITVKSVCQTMNETDEQIKVMLQ